MQFVAEAGETLVFPQKREMVDEARVVELLESEGVASVTAPVRLDLSNKSYSDAAAMKLAEKLASFSSITDADIHDMIAGRPEEEALRSFAAIADSLVQNPIVSLNISDNALGAKGVEACRDLMIKGTLQRIYVLNNGISEAAGTSYGPYNVYYFYNIHQLMRNFTTLIHQRALH
jgi:Ran GTPase-activating protein (RanGAP) involved in mRNA processing and transport